MSRRFKLGSFEFSINRRNLDWKSALRSGRLKAFGWELWEDSAFIKVPSWGMIAMWSEELKISWVQRGQRSPPWRRSERRHWEPSWDNLPGLTAWIDSLELHGYCFSSLLDAVMAAAFAFHSSDAFVRAAFVDLVNQSLISHGDLCNYNAFSSSPVALRASSTH